VAVKIFPENYRSFVKLVSLLVQLICIVYKKHIGLSNKNLRTGSKNNNSNNNNNNNNKREPEAK